MKRQYSSDSDSSDTDSSGSSSGSDSSSDSDSDDSDSSSGSSDSRSSSSDRSRTDLIAAGADTVAVCLYWAFAILSQKPDVQTKLIEELDAWKAKNPPGAVPSFHKDREELPYSICVQKEVIRFRPVTNFGIPHMTSEDVIYVPYACKC
ncbi:hypothetical protein G6F68_013165 [Rhizopus microsporus]|nr:hypothetical protein G6F68_013165 [Rhizopus microsporus]